MINHSNVEEYIIDYIDGELSPLEELSLKEFLNIHPQYQEVLENYSKTIIEIDENISYPDKDKLFKKEESFFSKYLLPIGLAASIAIVVGTYSIFNLSDNSSVESTIITKPTIASQVDSNQSINPNVNNNLTNTNLPIIANNNINNNKKAPNKTKNYNNNIGNDQQSIIHSTLKEVAESVQTIAQIELENQPQPWVDYQIDIKASYVQWHNQPEWPKDESELELEIGHFSLPSKSNKIQALKEKIENQKEKILDGLAMFNEFEIPLSKN